MSTFKTAIRWVDGRGLYSCPQCTQRRQAIQPRRGTCRCGLTYTFTDFMCRVQWSGFSRPLTEEEIILLKELCA